VLEQLGLGPLPLRPGLSRSRLASLLIR
jgi:hypothetical protein